jgi:hypothetical protein
VTNIVSQPPLTLPLPHGCCEECPCGVEALAHPKYSFGMLLEARHLALEHRYSAQRLNTHDIRLHDFGTVCGLRVIKHPSPECVDKYAILQPGIALDCCGREIVVPETLFVPLFDGAESGWCGAAQSSAQVAPAGTKRTTLYVYLTYAQCDTDPIPTYVRACGCCEGTCEHGNCVPSVTREGYTVLVSTIAPPVWRNPVGAAYCSWLETQLKGPGASPQGYVIANETLDQVLCDVVTEPCANFCAPGNEWLLLATIAFTADDLLASIDNCTNRRLVLSTGAVVEALGCLTTAVTNCCKTKDAYLTLAGAVAPATVNVEAPPPSPTLTYTLTGTNADAALSTGAFSIDVVLPGGVTFGSAKLSVDGVAQPDPAPNATGISAPVASLAAGRSAQLVVTATYDPAQEHAGDVLTATASIGGYAGPSGANVALTTTFIDVGPPPPPVDGPHVKWQAAKLPTKMTFAVAAKQFAPGGPGLNLLFDAPMDTTRPPNGAVTTSIVTLSVKGVSVPVVARWTNATTLNVNGAQPEMETAIRALASGGGPIVLTLAGGPKDPALPLSPVMQSADGHRLDGSPADGTGAFATAGVSGDGRQGGDFTWTINVGAG